MKRVAIVLLVGALTVTGIGAYAAYARVHERYQGYSGAEQFVEIPSGVDSTAIGQRLVAAGVVRDLMTYRLALWLTGESRRLKAGEYRFDRPVTPVDVLQKIARGDVYLLAVTFREGLTIPEMASVFEASGIDQASGFADAAKNVALVQEIDPQATDLEGYLFPDTYLLPRRSDASRIVHLMVDRFRRALRPELRAIAGERGMSVRQLVTLASIVEKEAARPDERPLIAAVYSNRLRIGMALQCDSTVIHALQQAGKFTGNLRREDLQFDSPYNTYRYPGLPPGPIAAPGQPSLEAAARPADVNYLYFVSRNDGSHVFARTLDEHNRNVQKYQVQYFREKRRREAAGAGGVPDGVPH